MKLTAIEVRRYAEGPVTTKELHDGGGLYLRKRQGGCYWYLRMTDPMTGANQWHRMFNGDPQGGYPRKTLSAAREEAGRLWAIRRKGLDPRATAKREIEERGQAEETTRRDAARRISVEQLFDRWAATDLMPHIGGDGKRIGRKDGGQYVREQFVRRVFPVMGNLPVAEVRKADVLAILDGVKAEGKLRTANVLLADLKQMFRFAVERELIEHSPIELVQKRKIGGKDVKRDRVLSDDELGALVTQLPESNLSKRTELGLWLVLATGCRIGELMGAVWADAKPRQRELQDLIDQENMRQKSGAIQLGLVNLKTRTWHMPTTKNQRDHTIHISDFAFTKFSQLAELREEAENEDGVTSEFKLSPWLFPNAAGTGPVSIKSLGKQLADRQRSADQRLQNRARAVNALSLSGGRWTTHDLRRTAATTMSKLGTSNDVINECLNHIKPGISGVYIQDRRRDEQILAFDLLGTRLAALLAENGEPMSLPAS